MPPRTNLLAELLSLGAPVQAARLIRSGKTSLEMMDTLNTRYGPIPAETHVTIEGLANRIIRSADSYTASIRHGGDLPTEPIPTVRGFNPDPDLPGRHYYEVEVPFFTEQGPDIMVVTIKGDTALSPSEVAEAAIQEATDRLQQSPDGFGYDTDDLDVLSFDPVNVREIWQTF